MLQVLLVLLIDAVKLKLVKFIKQFLLYDEVNSLSVVGYWWSHDGRVRRLHRGAFFQVQELYGELIGSGRIKMVEMVVVGK